MVIFTFLFLPSLRLFQMILFELAVKCFMFYGMCAVPPASDDMRQFLIFMCLSTNTWNPARCEIGNGRLIIKRRYIINVFFVILIN